MLVRAEGQALAMDGDGAEGLRADLYDEIVSEAVARRIAALDPHRRQATLEGVDPAEVPTRVGEIIGGWAQEPVAVVENEGRVAAALLLAAEVGAFTVSGASDVRPEHRLSPPLQRLIAVEPLAPHR